MPHDNSFIPEAGEPDTFVAGKLVSVEHAKAVRRGWKAGCWYLGLQILGLIAASFYSELSPLSVALPLVTLALAGLCIWGVRNWRLLPAVGLFCLPIVNTLLLAMQTADQHLRAGQGQIRVFFLVIFLYLFAKAAISIWKVRHGGASAAH